VIYRQKPGRADLITCFLVLLGVVLFFVDGLQAGNLAGNAAAILSGVCYAGVFMMNTGEKADAVSSCFLGQLAAGILFTPLCFRETDFSLPTLAAVAAMGVIQVGGAYILFSIVIQGTPPVTASLITGMEPVLNPLLVAAFYGERVTALSVVGSVIVVCSILGYDLWTASRSRTA
jgi:drug/metabolite transporter (DMT)-like permease